MWKWREQRAMRADRERRAAVRAAVHQRAAREGLRLTDGQLAVLRLLSGEENVYLHGPPGRGKSWLVDAVVAALGARRWHLHEFFRDLHDGIGATGGLAPSVSALVGSARVVCLDEFTVHDPADGVLLDRVLRELHRRRIRIIVTSNRAPAELMPNPLFHSAFEPTIATIEAIFTVATLDDGRDLREAGAAVGLAAGGFRRGRWTICGAGSVRRAGGGRPVPSGEEMDEEGAVEFGFGELCEVPAHVTDYLSLAERFPRWRVTMPDECVAGPDALARWAALLDVAHDRDVELTVVASFGPGELADLLCSRLPDAARAVSRMSAWTVETAATVETAGTVETADTVDTAAVSER
ncbi:cell division protein ZapE [Gordonia sihwensis]|uniref:cell division protein ZapE n=1 Tax=Gordonia sihwensis TaxID=173559 RepID=UPI0021B3DA48|nr:cell division protein ZapE [Gordonia sihwensis]